MDAYGGDSRASALADLLELQAIQRGATISESQLTDYVADVGWGRSWAGKFLDAGDENDNDGPTARDHAVAAFGLLAERADLLEHHYPFALDGTRSLKRSSTGLTPYDLCLAISIAHAYDLDVGVNPRDYLEVVVVRFLNRVGLRAAGVAAVKRGGKKFEDALEACCKELGLRHSHTAAARRRKTFDSGVDVLGHISLSPMRTSPFAVVCQVTCGRSESWEAKLAQTSPHRWQKFLLSALLPTAMLAVPYHVETRHMRFIEDGGGF